MRTVWRQANVRFDEMMASLLCVGLRRDDQNIDEAPLATAVRQWVGDGLRWQMRTSVPRVSLFYLQTFGADGIFRVYQEFTDAIQTGAGLLGCLGNEYRLETVPANSDYADPDGACVIPLHRSEIFGPDGQVYVQRQPTADGQQED